MEYVWYALLGILGLFLTLFLIAVFRALAMKPITGIRKNVVASEETRRHYAQALGRMIREVTIAQPDVVMPEPFMKLQAVMDEIFPNVAKTVEKKIFEGGSLLYRWKGKHPKEDPIVLMAHQDVVPAPAEGWNHPPFSGVYENGEVHGRGTFDTKGTLFAFFQAAEELMREGYQPEVDVYFASSCDEEIMGHGALDTVAWMKAQGIKPSLVLDEGGAIVEGVLPTSAKPLALLGILEKGYIDLKIIARSHGGHSSTPPKNSPIARLSKFVVDLEKHSPMRAKMIPEVADLFRTAAPTMAFPYRLLFGNLWLFKGLVTKLLPAVNAYGRALFSTTVAFTRIKGSDANNVIPSEASLVVNMRPHPIQDADESIDAIRKRAAKFDLEVEVLNARPCTPIVDVHGPEFQKLVEAVKEVFPDVLVSPYVILGGTDARHYQEICPATIRFSPVRATNEDLKKMHGLNESISVDGLVEAVAFYKHLIKIAK
jgi:carboxypeptidase PM20D1